MLKDRRAVGYQELKELDDKKSAEAAMHKEKENEMRNAVLIEKQRREQVERMRDASSSCSRRVAGTSSEWKRAKLPRKARKAKKGRRSDTFQHMVLYKRSCRNCTDLRAEELAFFAIASAEVEHWYQSSSVFRRRSLTSCNFYLDLLHKK